MPESTLTCMFRNVRVCNWSRPTPPGAPKEYYEFPRVIQGKDKEGNPLPPLVKFKAQYFDGDDYCTVEFVARRGMAAKVLAMNLRCDQQYRSHLDIMSQCRHDKYEKEGRTLKHEYHEIVFIDFASGYAPPDTNDTPREQTRREEAAQAYVGPAPKSTGPATQITPPPSVPRILLGTPEDPFLHY